VINKKYLTILIIFFAARFCLAGTVELALSFDDGPGFDSHNYTSEERADKLLNTLKKRNIEGAIFFVNMCNLKEIDRSIKVVRKYFQNGHYVGNHTCMHYSYNKVSREKFTADVLLNQKYLEQVDTRLLTKYFRFPFFHEGQNLTERQYILDWLKKYQYVNVPATVYTEDYKFDEKMINVDKKSDQYKSEQKKLLKSISNQIDIAMELSEKHLKRQVKHNIVLHEVDLTVDSLDMIIDLIISKKIKIVSLDQVITDQVYKKNINHTKTELGLLQQISYEKNK